MHSQATPAARRTTALRALALVGGLALLSGCASGTAEAPPTEAAPLELHPVGDPGQWLDTGYADGVTATYATANTVCGIADDLVIEMQTGPSFASRVLARPLAGGDVLWEAEDARCAPGAVLDGSALVARSWSGEPDWQLVDVATGETTLDLTLETERSSVDIVAQIDDLLVVSSAEGGLTGLRDGMPEWSAAVPAGATITALDDGHLGVLDGLGDRLLIIDGRSGDTTLEQDVERADWITWASDGYVEKINESDPEYAFFDVSGAEVDRTVGVSQYRFAPSPESGVTFPIADHVAAGRVVGVSADGIPSLFQDERQRDFTPEGSIELPASIISLRGISADGGLLLFRNDADGLVFIDGTGDEVFTWPVESGELSIEAGLLVVESGPTTQVLLPAGKSPVA